MDAPEPDETRKDVASTEEDFFNQSGMVTDAFKESDTSDQNRAINRDPAQGHDSGEVHPS